MKMRVTDKAISAAWLQAGKDLGIRVIAPFTVKTTENELVTYEAHILDFGGPKGTVVGVMGEALNDCGAAEGYYCSNLAPSYRSYGRQHFTDTLNDWGWYGPQEYRPPWYSGKSWS
jgi:hypothetical protein